jgi:hypothetical protein
MNKTSKILRATKFLREFNLWRRGEENLPQPDPRLVGEAIDDACTALECMIRPEEEGGDLPASGQGFSKTLDEVKEEAVVLRAKVVELEIRLEGAEKISAKVGAEWRKLVDEALTVAKEVTSSRHDPVHMSQLKKLEILQERAEELSENQTCLNNKPH